MFVGKNQAIATSLVNGNLGEKTSQNMTCPPPSSPPITQADYIDYGFRLPYELDDTPPSHHLFKIGSEPEFLRFERIKQ